MAQTTGQLGRRFAQSFLTQNQSRALRSRAPSSSAAFSTSHIRSQHIPSLADIKSDSAASFDAKSVEFRERVLKAKEKADRASSAPHTRPPVYDNAAASHVDSSTPTSGAALDASKPTYGLGNFSSDSPGDAREAARQADQTSGSTGSTEQPKKKGMFGSLIYGTEEGREMDRDIERSFSQVLARGKYVHSIVFHDVKPDKVEEYVDLVGGWYPKVAANPKNKVHLVGSWRTEVGDCDTFVHIWEYQKYDGYHDSLYNIHHGREFEEFDHKLKTLINSKRMSLMQEFSFWPTTAPRSLGGLFELRSYELHPGNLLEWETHWRKGLEARREVMEGVGAWFVQIGDLNTVHHLWQFANLEERKTRREQSWAHEGWSDTVHKTVPLIQRMKSRVLIPMPWSPIS